MSISSLGWREREVGRGRQETRCGSAWLAVRGHPAQPCGWPAASVCPAPAHGAGFQGGHAEAAWPVNDVCQSMDLRPHCLPSPQGNSLMWGSQEDFRGLSRSKRNRRPFTMSPEGFLFGFLGAGLCSLPNSSFLGTRGSHLPLLLHRSS